MEAKRIEKRGLSEISHPILENETVKLGIERKNVFEKIQELNEKTDSLTDGIYTFKLNKNKLGLYAGNQFIFSVE